MHMLRSHLYFLSLLVFASYPHLAQTQEPTEEKIRIAVSVLPLHAITSAVAEHEAEIILLRPPGQSLHGRSLPPATALAMRSADIIIWAGPPLEGELSKTFNSLAPEADVLTVLDIDGLLLLPLRTPHVHTGHTDHNDTIDIPSPNVDDSQAQEHHDEADHDSDSSNKQLETAPVDPHVWLDPRNASRIARAIAKALADIDPDRAERYHLNADLFSKSVRIMESDIEHLFAQQKHPSYIVLHDAFHYFEQRFNLRSPQVLMKNPEIPPGAAHARAIRRFIHDHDVRCIFTEPQSRRNALVTYANEYGKTIRVLDPVGKKLNRNQTGTQRYRHLLMTLAGNLVSCFNVS